jgi:hypothetical protein
MRELIDVTMRSKKDAVTITHAFTVQHWRETFCFPDPATRELLIIDQITLQKNKKMFLCLTEEQRDKKKDVTVKRKENASLRSTNFPVY